MRRRKAVVELNGIEPSTS